LSLPKHGDYLTICTKFVSTKTLKLPKHELQAKLFQNKKATTKIKLQAKLFQKMVQSFFKKW
jgi:hypothetical protein